MGGYESNLDMPEEAWLESDGSWSEDDCDYLEQTKYIRAARAAKRERELIKRAEQCVPTNWLDPLLTGPEAVIPRNVDGRAIEALLRGVQDRIRGLANESQNARSGGQRN